MLLAILVSLAQAGDCTLELEQRFDAPFQVYGAAAVAVGDQLYLVGGSGPDGVSGDIWKLSGSTWTKEPATIENRRYHSAAPWGESLVVVDGYGFDGDERASRTTVQSIAGDAVTKAPVERYLSGVAAHDGKLYVAGGHQEGRRFLQRVDIYDGEAWSEGPPLAGARDTRLVEADGRLYALGGFAGDDCEPSSAVERLAADGTSWEPVRPMFEGVSAFSVATLAGGIFTFGDYDVPERVGRYDIATDTWQLLDVDFTPRRHTAAETVGDKIVVVGGNVANEGSWMSTTEIYKWSCE